MSKPFKYLSLPLSHVTSFLVPMTPSGNPFPGFQQLSLLQPSIQLGLSVRLYNVSELEVSGDLRCVCGGP